MNNYYNTIYLAQSYGEGSYNTNLYGADKSTSTGTNTATGSSLLTNTGFDVLLAGSVSVLIIFGALAVKFWKRPSKTQTPTSQK